MENKLITRLRSATGQVHKDLESLPVSKLIMSAGLTEDGYVDYLQKVYAIHHSIENNVFPIIADTITDIEQRNKVAHIVTDLTALNASVPADDLFLNAGFRSDIPFCMGMLYVSEGSTLGGQYILKNVQKTLGEKAMNATAFLNVYGSRTGSMWKTFIEFLNTYETSLTVNQMEDVAAGAVYAFARTAVVFGAR